MPGNTISWGPFWFFPMFMPVFILIVVILCLYFFFSRGGCRFPLAGSDKGGGEPESALDILKRRYAKGELTREEFMQMKQDIS